MRITTTLVSVMLSIFSLVMVTGFIYNVPVCDHLSCKVIETTLYSLIIAGSSCFCYKCLDSQLKRNIEPLDLLFCYE